MDFTTFQHAIRQQFDMMTDTGLYHVEVGADEKSVVPEGQRRPSLLWTTYLQSFPDGANPLYRVRTEHDCSCCRAFLRQMGGVVTIRDNQLVTLWDCLIDGPYQVVAQAMNTLVRTTAHRQGIANVFLSSSNSVGTAQTRELLPSGRVQTYDHFAVNVPTAYRQAREAIPATLAEARATHDVLLRALTELTTEAIETVMDLIARNTLYRGAEHHHAVKAIQECHRQFHTLDTPFTREIYAWAQGRTLPAPVARIRNTALGTLLVDLSEGRDLEAAVRAYEHIMAPTNYQRPTALVTRAMIAKAQAEVAHLGLTTALERRYATLDDITITNVLWADRSAKRAMGVFDQLAATVPDKLRNNNHMEEMPIDAFLTDVLPSTTGLEIYLDNSHARHFVSLIAPGDPTAPLLFQWDNHFSWTYAGDLADSMKERVKRAGGNVEADFRASLSWSNFDDLDLHLREPGGFEIYFAQGRHPATSPHHGQLDVDMNAGSGRTRTPVENIVYPHRAQMAEGVYTLFVHNYAKRENQDVGFEAEIEFDGQQHRFVYEQAVRDSQRVQVAEFRYTHAEGLTILASLPSTQTSRVVWGLTSQTFQKVTVVLLSPNCWDGRAFGNKHYFFMLEGCQRADEARGFFNEYLRADLRQHRKVLEVVGARMRTDDSARQLSGVGFSSTVHQSLLCRTQGHRVVKVTV